SMRLAASRAFSIRSKPTLVRNRGEKSKVVLIATSSFEQHGYKTARNVVTREGRLQLVSRRQMIWESRKRVAGGANHQNRNAAGRDSNGKFCHIPSRRRRQQMITGPLCKAARALVQVSRSKLASRTNVRKETIEMFERGLNTPDDPTVEALQTALEALGAVF